MITLCFARASTGEEAIAVAETLLPDIALVDVKMPGMGGTAATRAIVARNPHIGVIMLTMFEDDESVFSVLEAGARGYVLKDADRGTLVRAIRAVARGEALLGPSVASACSNSLEPRPQARPSLHHRPRPCLICSVTSRRANAMSCT